jgi:non-specific serine/threonine protein kinase
VAREVADNFPDGVAFVALGALTDPALVPEAIARALVVPQVAGTPPLDALATALRGRRLLLVLDNFEHLTGASADVATLLMACPTLLALVTSRAPLHVRGEQEYRVPPLALPELGSGANPDLALAADAVRLFVARAAAVQPNFTLTPANATAVVEICRRLDGLPLAIELAAARIRLLSPATLLARLDRTLPLLADGPRDLPARQRTMRDAIAWSHDLLAPEERVTFARLAVFGGGGTLAACEAICADDSDETLAVLEHLTALLHNNLLVQGRAGDGEDPAGDPRFRMLEPIREYAAEQLAARGEADALHRRHAEYYLNLAAVARADQSAWLRQIEAEHDNLRGALRWALAPGADGLRTGLGLRLSIALWWFWEVRGHLTEGRSWLARALAVATGVPPQRRAEALIGSGTLAMRQGDYASADTSFAECLDLWRRLGHDDGIARVLTTLGEVALRRGDHARASGLLEESLTLKRALGDQSGIAESLNIAGLVARDRGDFGHAWVLFEESLALMRALDRPWGTIVALSNLGHLALRQGDDARATALLHECLPLSRELGARWSIAYCLEGLAGVAAHRGDGGRAARLWGAAEALREGIGAPLPPNLASHHAGLVATARALADPAMWEANWAAGRALSPDAAIADAAR